MFIRYFKSSYFPQYVLLAVLGLFLWGYSLIVPGNYIPGSNIQPAYNLVLKIFYGNSYLLATVGFIVLYFQSLFFNEILVKNEIVPKNSLIPAFIYLLFASTAESLLIFNPLSFANLFLVLAVDRILYCYSNTRTSRAILSASLFVSLASLFYLPSILIIVLLYIMLINFSITGWRFWIIPLIGLILPYLYLFTFYFVTDDLNNILQDYTAYWYNLKFLFGKISSIKYLASGVLILMTVVSFFYYLTHIQEKNIVIRRKMVIFLFFTILTCLIASLNISTIGLSYVLTALPLSAFVSFYLGDIKVKKIHEYFIWILLIVSFLINYQII